MLVSEVNASSVETFSRVSPDALIALSADNAQQQLHQQAQQHALEQRLTTPEPDARTAKPPAAIPASGYPVERPCFDFTQVKLDGKDSLPNRRALQRIVQAAQGRCLGQQGINLLMRRLQNALMEEGYITTRIVAPQQDLTQGRLHLTVLPGKIRQIRPAPATQPRVSLRSAFPRAAGQLLNLRDLEQGLENLQRVLTVAVDMAIVATDQPGESDILVNWQQPRFWRLGLSLDDSGTRSTGRYQTAATVFIDNPLTLSDSLYLNAGRSLRARGGKGTHNYTGQYTLPTGYWLARVTGSYNDYTQSIAGVNEDYRYRGETQQFSLQVGRMIHRGTYHKTRLTGEIMLREAKNFIDDTAIDAQHRKTSAWKIALNHQQNLNPFTLDIDASYQQGTRWFGALPAAEEFFDEATALSRIVRLGAELGVPFALGGQNFHYNLNYQQQLTSTPLTPPEQFSIGGRWTVRGFEGERSLSADQGWLVRNEWRWYTPLTGQQLYLGIDYGQLTGRTAFQPLGRRLLGSALGVRGTLGSFHYDAFLGVPLSYPAGFIEDKVTLGFTLNWYY